MWRFILVAYICIMRNYSKVGGKSGAPGYRVPSSFRSRVFEVVKNIPKGKTLTYRQVAELAGKPDAQRAVGNILHANRDKDIPCHRVIRGDGSLGGYNRGTQCKKSILELEREESRVGGGWESVI